MNLNLRCEINGKILTIPVEISDEQLLQLSEIAEQIPEQNGWDKPENGKVYYYEDALCRVQSIRMNDSSAVQMDMLYEKANCYSNELLATDMARADALMRELRRFAAEKRIREIDNIAGGYTITYNYLDKCLEIGMTSSWKAFGDIVFESEELARDAINTYAEELIWYFTEMKDRF